MKKVQKKIGRDYTMLNEKQQLAVETIEGPLLILAGAGSGKTTVLIHRIEHMIQTGIDPTKILAIAFTNKAANEMQERLLAKVPPEQATKVWISTFHKFCMSVLRDYGDVLPGVGRNYLIASQEKIRNFLKTAIEATALTKEEEAALLFKPATLSRVISLLKNELMMPEDILNWVGKNNIPPDVDMSKVKRIVEEEIGKANFKTFVKVYMHYQKLLKKESLLDLDDILFYVAKLFQNHPQILNHYQDQFTYILVDEYQDTNQVQYITLKLLASKYKNFAAVGDDNQSIFGFRGSDIRNILQFEKDYPEAVSIKLEENYRSTQTILEVANQIISHNKEKKNKQLYTSNPIGEKVKYVEVDLHVDEADWIAKKIKTLVKNGQNYRDIAVFYRNNSDSSSLERIFKKEGIPFKLSKDGGFFDQVEIVDLVKFLTFMHNSTDAAAFKRIINKPKRGIGATTVEKIIKEANGKDLLAICKHPDKLERINQKTKEGLLAFVQIIEELQNIIKQKKVSDLMEAILEKTDYESTFAESEASIKKIKKRNINKLITEAREMESKNNQLTVEEFLKDVTKKDMDAETDKNDEWNEVNLTTVHSAKGREFPVVFVIGMNEGSFPSQYALSPKAIEEERRLAYVAVTRAKESLYFTRSLLSIGKDDQGNETKTNTIISRFLSEFDQNLMETEK